MVAELLESVCNTMTKPYEVISTEDMLARIQECNDRLLEDRKEKIQRGEELTAEDEELFVIANDVVALFPSMTSDMTGKIVRELVEDSELEFEGLDYMEIARYIAIERDQTGDLEEIECLLPKRRKSRGVAPGIKNPECTKREKNTQIVWDFPDKSPTARQKRVMVARMAEIGVKTLFENFCYNFAGHSYLQLSGGPIGARVTMAAARLVMHHWSEQYRQILVRSGLDIKLFGGYVDDGRQATSKLAMGMRFVKESKSFEYKEEWEQADRAEDLPTLTRTARVCNVAMNSINRDLQFTTETEVDYKEMRLPSLDFYMWVERGLIHHSYYEKPMRTQLVLMRNSSMSIQQKMDILSNELVRRLSVVGGGVSRQEKVAIVDHYTKQLINSGYDRTMCREIVVCGLKVMRTKVLRRKKAGEKFYRTARSTLKRRVKKKLTAKTNWFKKKRQEDSPVPGGEKRTYPTTGGEGERYTAHMGRDETASTVPGKVETCLAGKGSQPHSPAGGDPDNRTKAVLFVPHTEGSCLAKALRELENMLEKMTGYRIKIQERAGEPLERILTKSNPWAGKDCERENCLLCATKIMTGKNIAQDCHKRNTTYETWCHTCYERDLGELEIGEDENQRREKEKSIILHKYIGESNRSCFERGLEHMRDRNYLNKGSHMLKHIVDKHGDEDMLKIKFGMRALKFHRASFERQIYESVMIQRNRGQHNLLNSKAEFNRCSIPRLCMKMGEKEYSIRGKENKLEEERELEMVEKIKKLRKNINKFRHERTPDITQPKRKKRKLEKTTMREITEEKEYIELQMEKSIAGRQEEVDRRKRQERKRKTQQTDIRTFYVGGEKEKKRQRVEEPPYKRITLEEMWRIVEENLEILRLCEISIAPDPHPLSATSPSPGSSTSPGPGCSECTSPVTMEDCGDEGEVGRRENNTSLENKIRGYTIVGDSLRSSTTSESTGQDYETIYSWNSQDKSPDPPGHQARRGSDELRSRTDLGENSWNSQGESTDTNLRCVESDLVRSPDPDLISCGWNRLTKHPPGSPGSSGHSQSGAGPDHGGEVQPGHQESKWAEKNILKPARLFDERYREEVQEETVPPKNVENKEIICEEEQYDDIDCEIFYDWNKIMKERREKLRIEENLRKERIQRAEAQEKSWELLRVCKELIREHTPEWQENLARQELRRIEREKGEEKENRLKSAENKQKQWKEKNIQTKINLKLRNGDETVKEEWRKYLMFDKEEREMRIDIAEARENLWKWRNEERGRGNKNRKEKIRKKFTIEKEEILEKRIKKLDEILKRCAEEKENERKYKEEEKSIVRKEAEKKKKRLEIKKLQEEKWGMVRWLSDFMNTNQEIIVQTTKENKEKKENQTLKEWEKLQRFEKIMYLKEKEGWTNGGRGGKGAIWRVKKLEKKLEEQPSQITPPGEFTMSMQGVGEVEEQSQQITSPGDITMPIQEGGEVEEQSRQITSPRDITMSIREGGTWRNKKSTHLEILRCQYRRGGRWRNSQTLRNSHNKSPHLEISRCQHRRWGEGGWRNSLSHRKSLIQWQ